MQAAPMALVTSWSDSAGVWPDFKKTAEAPVVLSPLSMALQIDPASVSACVWVFGGCPCAVWTWLSKSTYAATCIGCPGWWLLLPGGAVDAVVPIGVSGVAVFEDVVGAPLLQPTARAPSAAPSMIVLRTCMSVHLFPFVAQLNLTVNLGGTERTNSPTASVPRCVEDGLHA